MKKLFTIMALALCSLASLAEEYTCPYTDRKSVV